MKIILLYALLCAATSAAHTQKFSYTDLACFLISDGWLRTDTIQLVSELKILQKKCKEHDQSYSLMLAYWKKESYGKTKIKSSDHATTGSINAFQLTKICCKQYMPQATFDSINNSFELTCEVALLFRNDIDKRIRGLKRNRLAFNYGITGVKKLTVKQVESSTYAKDILELRYKYYQYLIENNYK